MNKTSATIAAGLLAMVPLVAHHQFSSEFDQNKSMTLTGTVSAFSFSDPHAQISLDVKNAQGNTESWKLEGASSNTLAKRGWTGSSLKKGDSITVEAYGATSGEKLASARAVTMPGGRKVSISDPTEDGGPAPTSAAALLSSTDTPANGELPATASYTPVIAMLGIASLIAAAAMSRRVRA